MIETRFKQQLFSNWLFFGPNIGFYTVGLNDLLSKSIDTESRVKRVPSCFTFAPR